VNPAWDLGRRRWPILRACQSGNWPGCNEAPWFA